MYYLLVCLALSFLYMCMFMPYEQGMSRVIDCPDCLCVITVVQVFIINAMPSLGNMKSYMLHETGTRRMHITVNTKL